MRLLAFTAAVLLPIVPVTAHNVIFGGEWIPISSNAGLNFYLGNSGEYERTVGVRPGLHWEQLMLEPLRAGITEDDAGGASAWWVRRGLSAIRDAPGRWLSDLGRKAGLGVAAVESGRNLELSFFGRYAPLLAWLPGWGVIFPLGAAGAFLAWRRRQDGALLLLVGCYALTLMVFFVSARYRLPMIPVFAVFAGFAVDRAWVWWNAGRRGSVLVLVGAVLLIGVAIRSDRVGAGPSAEENEADGYYLVAKAFANRDHHVAAVGSLEKALAVAPEHWDAVFDLAAAWTNLGQLPRALPLYERILAHHPEDRESLLALTDALLRLGREPEALERLSASAANSRATADLVFTICRKLFSLGEIETAVRVGREATARGVTDSHLEDLLGKMMRAIAERRHLAACLERTPGPAAPASLAVRGALVRAENLLRQGDHLDAELVAAVVVTASTDCHDDPAAWSLLGKLWFLQHASLAPDALRRAIRLDPGRAEAYLGLAHSLAADPEALAEATAALETFLELSPQGAEAERARHALSKLTARR
ncbi:MAG: tetratricopeptide repeat protein [Acidobacteria bacterium]|nr:tetratricopeptide repeat protein [Acidobacteriota bacterium]